MSSDNSFVEFLVEQIEDAGSITYKKMFGEYALYSNGKIFALVCNNQLFVKPTESGRKFIGENILEAPAYPKAKLSFLIEDRFEDREWFSELVRLTLSELPEPKPKKKKK